ncbi:hypothetical protein CDG81_12990 [Actinopolyspora erythraea]|uniref:Histidine-specific methyltransferase SAM-dependent domain-containing protein n=1 Tax=Actinopolyspora erythraea TaxID=414996 RepID=A0A099D5F4_9ACTN|nr:hypothetical protein [Actinopolyspora erythraea]ASU79049.1 hypothetical protein CDG81_12990 [Actinopolyspora erythraea]KGI81176.1 hypothetical protein IL38_13095 [Actinopolyspora erythraea]
MKTIDSNTIVAAGNTSMNEQVCRTLAKYLRLPASRIVVPKNADKYHNQFDRIAQDDSLEEVFNLMWNLNVTGLEDKTIGCTPHHQRSLSNTLDTTIQDLAKLLKNDRVQYTELGPEPAKTRHIINQLVNFGIRVDNYTAVDINPNSQSLMRSQLVDILPPENIDYAQSLFEELSDTDYRVPGTRNLVTMLGFEEGNDHPRSVASLLESVLESGDVFLSEMQLLPRLDWSPIYNFYQSEVMRRFSRVALERTYGNLRSDYGFYLIPLALNHVGVQTMVAVTAETIHDADPELDGTVFVTNYCIKYSADEYIASREASGNVKVLAQHTTADGSVAFQISQKI